MNRFVLAFLCVTALSSFANASYDSSLSSNRTPKQASIWTSACDECQIIIKRIVAVAKDPTKLGELKALLSLLCRETSYQEECRLFVSNIDRFIQELLPYMKDAHATCQKLHICSNTKLQQLHRVGLLYAKKYLNKLDGANDLICEECEFAAHELQLYVESKSNQEKIKSFLEDEVCAHLGQQLHGPCNEMVEVFLPDLFNELKDMLKDNHQFCQQLALCPSSNTAVVPSSKTIKKHDSSVGSLNRLVKQITQLSAYKGTLKVNMGCLECRLAMDALLFELQRNSTVHKLAKEIRHTLCPILPNSYHQGCDDFLRLYASTIVYMTFKQFDSQSVCTNAHLCTAETYRATSLVRSYKDVKHLKCKSCKVISELVITEIAKPEFRADLIEDISHQVCEQLPSSLLYICENLTKSYVPVVLTRLLQKMDDDTICYIIRACH